VQGQRRLAQRFLKDIEPTMIDPKQGPLFHPGRGEQHVANLQTKLANASAAKATEVIRRRPMLTVVK